MIARLLRFGRGRPLALSLLLLLLVPYAWPNLSPFTPVRLAWFDACQRLFPRPRTTAPVTLVAIDEASLRRMGQWPWPRQRLAAVVDAINAQGPLAIGLDMIFAEPDTTSPEALAQRLPPGNGGLRGALAALPAYDAILARSLQAAPAVLGAAGLNETSPAVSHALRMWPVVVTGSDPRPFLRHYPSALASLQSPFQQAASGQALLSADLEYGVVRRVPLLFVVNNSLVPGFAMEMLRVAIGAPAIGIESGTDGPIAVTVGDLRVPVDSNGEVWVHYGRFDAARYVSAADLLTGKVDADFIKDKLVILAQTGMGLMDYKTTARGDYVPGVEVHAQMIESFIDGSFLTRPGWLQWAETGGFAALSLLLIWGVPQMRPRNAILLMPALALLLFGAGAASFVWAGWLLDAATLFISSLLVLGGLISSGLIESDRERRRIAQSLQQAQVEAARTAGELDAARQIQLGSLPDAAQVFAAESRFEIAALLEPAREVGGDLYEFFPLDERRIYFAVADVSGKGVPAALFMAVTKALSKSLALRGCSSPAEVLRNADMELARENPASLFVTVVAGVLDAETGRVEIANAGHDAPWHIDRAGNIRRVETRGGPPLCVIDGFDYTAETLQLAPGDLLILTTDGVAEAVNASGELYGNARLLQALQNARPTGAAAAIAALREDVRRFVGAAEAADDITLLCLRWNGRGND